MFGFTTLEIVANEPIPERVPVTFNGRIADSRLLQHFWRVAGFSKSATNRGFVVDLVTDGELFMPDYTWVINKEIYLNGLGKLSQNPPNSRFVQILGIAKDPRTMIIKLGEPILL